MSLSEYLKDYLETTPRKEIITAWRLSEKYDEVNSPSIEEFFTFSKNYFKIENKPLKQSLKDNFISNTTNPNFEFGFFLF